MPDAYVYPGGALEDADANLDDKHIAAFVEPERVLAEQEYYVAALRECFEESNLLVAMEGERPTDGERARWREKLLADTDGMAAFLKATGLQLNLAQLAYFDRWITPPFETKRFDARFFLARVSKSAEAMEDEREVVEARWMTPSDALERHSAGELRLFPPTWATLSWLAQFADTESAMRAARDRDVHPIEPHFQSGEDGVVAYLPGHDAYPDNEAQGPSCALWLHDGVWSFSPDRIEHRWSRRLEP
jgi:8-oxo-dGTP pyrophosphatase MutT (NUDIX family)